MDFNKIIQAEFNRMQDDGEIEEAIRARAKKAIEGAIDDAFNSWRGLGKQINEAVEGAIKLDLSALSLDEYNLMITQMVKHTALEHLEEKGQKAIAERLSELLAPVPEKITVQGVIDRCVEFWHDDYSDLGYSGKVEVEQSTWSDTSTTFKLYKEQPLDSIYATKRPDVEFYVSNNKIRIPRMDATRWPTNNGYGAEAYIYQLFCAGSEITDAHTVSEYDLSIIYGDG